MKLFVKNMVCDRCVRVVKQELEKIGLIPQAVSLGEITLEKEPTNEQRQQIENAFQSLGFALIDDKKSRLIEKIKNRIIDLVHQKENLLKTNLSDYLAEQLHQDYNYMAGLFSEVEGITIEKYYIAQRIERVKELLVYDELTLSEIAFRMHYSSVAHLSNQFKKVTGLTPSFFRNIGLEKRKPLDKVS